MSRKVRVVAALFRRGDTVLVQERPAHKARGGLWEFPGGKVEPGESDAVALARECQEELGVTVEVGTEVWRTEHVYDDLTVELVLITASMSRDALPQPHEAGRLAWVARPELSRLPFCEADLPLVDLLAGGAFS